LGVIKDLYTALRQRHEGVENSKGKVVRKGKRKLNNWMGAWDKK